MGLGRHDLTEQPEQIGKPDRVGKKAPDHHQRGHCRKERQQREKGNPGRIQTEIASIGSFRDGLDDGPDPQRAIHPPSPLTGGWRQPADRRSAR